MNISLDDTVGLYEKGNRKYLVHIERKERKCSTGTKYVGKIRKILISDRVGCSFTKSISSEMSQSLIEKSPFSSALVIVNPVGGCHKAQRTFASIKFMFDIAGINICYRETQFDGHIHEILKEESDKQYSVIVVVGGDGMFHHVLNGLLGQNSGNVLQQIILAIIPAGSGNGLAHSLGLGCPVLAALAIIKGRVEQIDLFSCREITEEGISRSHRLGHLSLTWGLIADADIASDSIRFLPGCKYELAFVYCLLKKKRYKADIYVLKAEKEDCEHYDKLSISDYQLVQSDNIISLICLNQPFISAKCLYAADCKLNDGKFVLSIIADDSKKISNMSIIEAFERTNVASNSVSSTFHCKSIRIIFHELNGILDLDGERIPTSSLHIEILPKHLSVIVPSKFGLL